MSTILQDIQNIEVISAHEHIGSLSCFGAGTDIFFPTDEIPHLSPCKAANLNDLFLSPYYAGPIFSSGYKYLNEDLCNQETFFQWHKNIMPSLELTQNLGVFHTLFIAFQELYGQDIWNPSEAWKLNSLLKEHYENYPLWYQTVLRESKTKWIIKPVHPQYFQNEINGFESAYVKPIARIDSLLGTINNGKLTFNCLQCSMKTDPQQLDDCLEAIDRFFVLIQDKAVGIKQLQAYFRPLHTSTPSYAEAKQAFVPALRFGGNEAYVVQDYLHRYILDQAEKHEMAYQIHTGMTNLKNSNPAALEPLIQNYPHIRFVLLHCYPFISEVTYLARVYPNCFVDTSWLAIQGDQILETALTQYTAMLPLNKVTISVDATSLEEYYGGMNISKNVLARVLSKAITQKELSPTGANLAAENFLYKNTATIYNL